MIQSIIEKNHFSLKQVTPIAEMQGKLWEMEHTKSGAKLVWLERPDENMTFSIGFRTIPTDSTGVFHILEHSVLNGSDKYPVREPFVELLKSSLQTFLNAMTFPDKTIYPISSRNKQDFMNLMSVYMDAVLHPNAVKNPNIFRQEGWRVELPEGGEPIFQGVVYNEMKGAYSNVGSVLEDTMMEYLFPDNCYRHSSGGDPAHIPELTYEQFVSEHAKYYHPSNALIVLDGQVDLDETLGFLNSCLASYDRQEMVFPIPMQKPLPFAQKEIPYEVGADEDITNKTIVSYGKLLCSFADAVELNAATILANYLSDGSEAPLKRAVLDAGLGEDMFVDLHDGIQQAWFGWQVWNTQKEKLPRIRQTIRQTVEKILAEGLDHDRLLGCYNSLAFRLMDRDNYGYPRGLVETLTIYDPWLYGGEPGQNLAYHSILEELKQKLSSGYFEELLRKCFLSEDDGFLAVLVPSQTLGAERVAQEKQRVAAYWGGKTQQEQDAIRAELNVLHSWQNTPDTPEMLAAMPMLSLADIQGDPKPLNVTGETENGVSVLKHTVDSDLVYVDLAFEASDVAEEDLPVLNVLTNLLSVLATEGKSSAQLQTEVRQKIGHLSFEIGVYPAGLDGHRMVFIARTTDLPDFKAEATSLLTEILTSTKFTDGEAVRNILRQEKIAGQHRLVSQGNRFAARRVLASQTSAGAAVEKLSGCEYIRWIGGISECGQEELDGLLARLEALCKKLFTRRRLTISVSANGYDLVKSLTEAFPEGEVPAKSGSVTLLPKCREGILIPAGVGYAAKGINMGRLGAEFTGSYYVLSNLLTFEHLWNAVRVQGGAYGTGFRGDPNGDVVATSYRDPSPGRSLEHFNACADVVEKFCAAGEDVTRYVLGAMSDADPLLSAAKKIYLAESRYFRGTTQEDVVRYHRQLLNTSLSDLNALVPVLRAMAQDRSCCIVGGQEKLDACGEELEIITKVLN